MKTVKGPDGNSVTWKRTLTRVEPDAIYWYAVARHRGIAVHHLPDQPVRVFDSVDGLAGVFRDMGSMQFNKRTRRWSVWACSDATEEDLSTLIGGAAWYSAHHGASARASLDGLCWEHWTKSNGDDVVSAICCFKLGVDDLLTATEEKVEIPESPAMLAPLVDQHYADLLRGAETDQRFAEKLRRRVAGDASASREAGPA